MTPRPSARASTYVGLQFKLSREASGSDHIHADRIAFLLARPARRTASHVGSLRGPGIAEVTSPAGIARRPDSSQSPIFPRSPPAPRVVMKKNLPPITRRRGGW